MQVSITEKVLGTPAGDTLLGKTVGLASGTVMLFTLIKNQASLSPAADS